MKKITFVLLALLLSTNLIANKYRIIETDIKTNPASLKLFGTTKAQSVEREIPLDYNKIFENETEIFEYIEDYKIRLANVRAFENINVDFSIKPASDYDLTSINSISPDEYEVLSQIQDLFFVTLLVELTDSIHVLAMPYIKYNSNTGSSLKIKMKDTNFLGTLNTMAAEFLFNVEQKDESDKPKYNFELGFSYDQPYYLDPFELTWVNDYSISYSIGEKSPEWNAKTGLQAKLPFDRISYIFEFYQYFIKNFDYAIYSDSLYLAEEGKISVPFTIYQTKHWGNLVWTPYISLVHNWDFDHINELNTDLSSPTMTAGHSFAISRINWNNNFRTGFNLSLANSYSYNFQRKMLYPSISFESMLYQEIELFEGKNFNRLGICLDFYYFTNFVNTIYKDNPFYQNDGSSIGDRLRGIRDNQYYLDPRCGKSTVTTSAFVLNMDFPFHLFSTNFEHKFLKYFNFDLQLSPFIDMALIYNKYTKEWYNPKDGFYTAGLEVLVYPQKFSSYTVRASVGYDIGRKLFDDYLNMDWRENVSKYEISIGLGLHY